MDRRVSALRLRDLLGPAPEQSPAYLGIADALRLLVTDGRVPAGTRLPSERELTRELGVSRTTVTRAYAVLRERGYLESRHGSGSVARLPSAAGVPMDNLLSPGRSGDDLLDLTCAAPVAPAGVVAAYESALEQLPAFLAGTGYFPTGVPVLREAVAERYAERGLPTRPEQVIVTSGGLAAIAIAARALISPGDRVLMESPTYPNAIATFRRSGARVVGVDVGPASWPMGEVCDTVGRVRPAAAYLVPDFHNPTGLLMSDEHRAQLAHALRRVRAVPIVDETLADLVLDDVEPARPFAAHAKEAVSVGSASKAYWGGLRVGWLRVPASRVGDFVTARLSLDLGAPLVDQLALVDLLRRREEVLAVRREQLVTSRAALLAALAEQLPQWRYSVPPGGLSLWCRLPAPRSSSLASAAEAHGLLLAPGPAFAPEGGLESFLRLPYTRPGEELGAAVTALASAWADTERRRPRRRRQPPLVA